MTDGEIFDLTESDEGLVVNFSSNMESIDEADRLTREFLKENGHGTIVFPISLVLREGLTNAVRHAHKYDTGKLVHYSLSLVDKKLIMVIEDQGEGFDWASAMEREPVLEEDHGRGISIMKEYFTDFWYNEKGNKLTLLKELD